MKTGKVAGILKKLEALVTRRAFWPLFCLAFLCGHVLYKMLSHPFSYYNDDLAHLFILNKYINGGFPIGPTWGPTFDAFAIMIGIKVLYIPILTLFKLVGAGYPYIGASKFWAFILLPLSFVVWARYLRLPLGKTLGMWGALAVTCYNVANSVIMDGLTRSFYVAILGFWLLALRSRSFFWINAVIFVASTFYPILLPLMGISLFFALSWFWRSERPLKWRALLLLTGFLSSVVYFVLRGILNPLIHSQKFLSYKQILSQGNNNADFCAWFDVTRLSGRLGDQSVFDWLHFNVFYSWQFISRQTGYIIGTAIFCIIVSGVASHFIKKQKLIPYFYATAFIVSIAGALLAGISSSPSVAASWWLALSMLAWCFFYQEASFVKIPREMKPLMMAAPIAFLIVFVIFSFQGLAANTPGRQLQRAFGVVGPVLALLWVHEVWGHCNACLRRLVKPIVIAGIVVLLWYIPPAPKFRYPNESVMRFLKGLPEDSLIMAYHRTADFILVLAGRNTTMPFEFIRPVVEPAWTRVKLQHIEEMQAYYANGPEPVRTWCKEDPEKRFILVEKEKYSPEAVKRLLHPLNKQVESGRDRGFFLLNLPEKCRRELAGEVWLVPCADLLNCPFQMDGQAVSGHGQPGP